MNQKKSQLNVQIDTLLLVALKAEAIKSGKTLTAFVTERLKQSPVVVEDDILEERLIKIEQQLDLLKNFTSDFYDKHNPSLSIFSDSGAKRYGEVARELFEFHRKKKKLSAKDAFAELSKCLANYDSIPELVIQLLTGKHELTGREMTDAYRNGNCGMRSALTEWTNSSLEPLNEAFLSAVEMENLI